MEAQKRLEEIMQKMVSEMPYYLPTHIVPYINEALASAYNVAISDAAEAATMKVHDGTTKQDFPSKWHQEGANNITVDKQSILKLKIT